LAILKTLSHADLARIQSFALEYHEEAYDLDSLFASFWTGKYIM